MKPLNFTIAAIAVLLTSTPTWAQTAADIVRDTVFSEVEKRIIGEHFGVKIQDLGQDAAMPRWAVKSEDDDDDDERDDDDRENGKKNKGAKGQGKGQGKAGGKLGGKPGG